jgi:AmmeMemoRadiSam system protein B
LILSGTDADGHICVNQCIEVIIFNAFVLAYYGKRRKEMLRQPQVSGQFYPSTRDELLKELDKFIKKNLRKEKAIAIVSPHAGYSYSGTVAAEVFSRIELPDTIIAIGPNHTGMGPPFSLMSKGTWLTPLGKVCIDEMLAQEIIEHSQYLKDDTQAHQYEHSLEVQLPFVQYFKPEFSFVPIIVADDRLDILKKVGEELANVVMPLKRDILFLASSDMTHYESHLNAEKKDKLAIDAILQLDEELLYSRVREYDISMCGYAPCIIILVAAKQLGAGKAELVKYQTSAETSGDYNSVVGYAGITLK